MNNFFIRLVLFLFIAFSNYTTVFADPTVDLPWMTGPLLAASGHTIAPGHVNLEPYVFATDDYGIYNDQWKTSSAPHNQIVSPTIIASVGLLNWADLQVSIPYNFKSEGSQSDNGIGDMSLTLGFQLLEDQPHAFRPDLRFSVEETFPTGVYQHLNPGRTGVEAMGAGLYQTSLAANFQKMFYLSNNKFLRTRLSLTYTIPSSVIVSGFNAYGGGVGTSGKVSVKGKFSADLAMEYTLTKHWVPALDILASFSGGATFAGAPGLTLLNLPAENSSPSSDTISMAPALEYNVSANIGVIAGAWFSIFGRNTPDFASAVVALNIYK